MTLDWKDISVQFKAIQLIVGYTAKSVMHANVMADLSRPSTQGKKCMRLTSILLYLLNCTFVVWIVVVIGRCYNLQVKV